MHQIITTSEQGLTRGFRALVLVALVLAGCVITLGAYVRLSDAGLGCPDWPGCYGHFLGVPEQDHEVTAAQQAFPGSSVHAPKAWKEMVHRYAAGTLGLLIAALTVMSWWPRPRGHAARWTALLLVLVAMQAALGMWTVTKLLKPVIVTLHLLGGMGIWVVLWGLWLRQDRTQGLLHGRVPDWRFVAWGIVVLVLIQVALGGWTSSNYAAMACADYPTCQGSWWPDMDWRQAFTLDRPLGQTAQGEGLPLSALTAIHWAHRWFAVVVVIGVLTWARRLWAISVLRGYAVALIVAVLVQLSLGLLNVFLQWPLNLAVLHNTGAACLLAVALATAMRVSATRRSM